MLEAIEQPDKRDRDRRRGASARAGRRVAADEEVHSLLDPESLDRRLDQVEVPVVLELAEAADLEESVEVGRDDPDRSRRYAATSVA